MSFLKANVLTTRDFTFGSRRLGQLIAAPTGRLDKVSIFLEPVIADSAVAATVNVVVELYDLDSFGLPSGVPLASDSKALSDIPVSGFVNFRLEADVPTICAAVLYVTNGDENNHVAWRYDVASSGGYDALTSTDGGINWTSDPTRLFAYRAFSQVSDAIDSDQQTALVQAGTINNITDNTDAEFELGDLERTVASGDTVAIDFGDFVVTLVIDQSGSMTWNDREGLRFDFMKQIVADLDSSVPPSSEITFSVLKFRGRRIGKMTIDVQGSASTGIDFTGVKIVRTTGTPPTGPADGIEVFRGFGQQFKDENLTVGTKYFYGIYSFADFGSTILFSADEPKTDYARPNAPPKAPLTVAGFKAVEVLTDSGGIELAEGATDFGYRRIDLSWLNPAGFDYSNIVLVRRDDRMPESPLDGTILLPDTTVPATTTFTDSLSGTYEFVSGVTYFYRIFTINSIGIKCITANAGKASVKVSAPERPWEQLEPPANVAPFGFDTTPPGTPTYALTLGNGEIKLDWTAADADSKRYRLYFKDNRYPVATDDKATSYDGDLLYDGPLTTFTHRFLTNGQPHFYVIVAFDRVGNVSLPAKVLFSGLPPKPSATSTTFVEPPAVLDFSAEVLNSTTTLLTWTNPKLTGDGASTFFFGDTVRVVATVDFLDPGDISSFMTFEFEETTRVVRYWSEDNKVDESIAVKVEHAPTLNATSIAANISMIPLIPIQDKISDVAVTLRAVLSVKNSVTGDPVARIVTKDVNVTLKHPFSIDIKNEPEQKVSRRTWKSVGDPLEPCEQWEYSSDSIPGVYVLSGDPFFALVEASYRDAPLGEPLDIAISLIDKTTGETSQVIKIAEAQGEDSVTLQTAETNDEILDRTGQPTGDTKARSLINLTLPPSNVPGDFTIEAIGSFNGYTRTATLDVHYEPILNIDLNLNAYQPDNVDRTEQSAFVYLAPYDADPSEKVAVPDFTITEWSIRPLCLRAKVRPLQSEDTVTGVGVMAYTRGGLANKIFWGPGDDVEDRQSYEVHVTTKANGMTAEAYGILELNEVQDTRINRIFLRPVGGGLSVKDLIADGFDISEWEVVAKPEDDGDPTDEESGQYFRNAVLEVGGLVPSLEDGRIVTLVARVIDNTDDETFKTSKVAENVRIKTNMTGTSGRAYNAKARIVNGKASFSILCNTRVPQLTELEDQANVNAELFGNMIYRGAKFQKPKSGCYLVLEVYTSIEVNGTPVAFRGGGENLLWDSPPSFIELIEPLRLT